MSSIDHHTGSTPNQNVLLITTQEHFCMNPKPGCASTENFDPTIRTLSATSDPGNVIFMNNKLDISSQSRTMGPGHGVSQQTQSDFNADFLIPGYLPQALRNTTELESAEKRLEKSDNFVVQIIQNPGQKLRKASKTVSADGSLSD